MSEKRAAYYTVSRDKLLPPINQTIATHRLARNIDTAHQNGDLLLLAMQLDLILSKHPEGNIPLTAGKLEVLIIQAAKAMLSE